MSIPKAGGAVVVSEGETIGLPEVRNILAPAIIALRQRLGSSAGSEDVGASVAELTFGAAAAIALAYVVLTGDGLAGGCTVEVDVTA
jgi:hypothetical protein